MWCLLKILLRFSFTPDMYVIPMVLYLICFSSSPVVWCGSWGSKNNCWPLCVGFQYSKMEASVLFNVHGTVQEGQAVVAELDVTVHRVDVFCEGFLGFNFDLCVHKSAPVAQRCSFVLLLPCRCWLQ